MRRGSCPVILFALHPTKKVTLSARRVPLNPDEYFSHPCAHPRVLDLVSSLWENVGATLIPSSLSLFFFNVSLRSLSVNEWKFFLFFPFLFLFPVNTIRGRRGGTGGGGRYRGRGKREALLSRPVFLANAPKLEGGGGNILSLASIVSLERDRPRWY